MIACLVVVGFEELFVVVETVVVAILVVVVAVVGSFAVESFVAVEVVVEVVGVDFVSVEECLIEEVVVFGHMIVVMLAYFHARCLLSDVAALVSLPRSRVVLCPVVAATWRVVGNTRSSLASADQLVASNSRCGPDMFVGTAARSRISALRPQGSFQGSGR